MNARDASSEVDAGIAASFAKAEHREPLLHPALGFVSGDSRLAFQAWAGLLAELRNCLFERSDPKVTALKSAWWSEEFQGLARGAARHPVSRALVGHGLPWVDVAGPLLAVAADLDPPGTIEDAFRGVLPLTSALARVERRLFDARAPEADIARALAIHWLRQRLEHGREALDRARIPLALFARHGLRRDQLGSDDAEALCRDWAGQLSDALPTPSDAGWPYLRLITLDADRQWLEARRKGLACPRRGRFSALWRAWRLARNAALQVDRAASSRT